MRSYSATNIFTRRELAMLGDAEALVRAVRQPPGRLIRCHELARAVCMALRTWYGGSRSKLRVVDGHYGAVQHSWIFVDGSLRGLPCRHILDVYAVGRLPMVQLVDPAAPTGEPYRCHSFKPRNDIDLGITTVMADRMFAVMKRRHAALRGAQERRRLERAGRRSAVRDA